MKLLTGLRLIILFTSFSSCTMKKHPKNDFDRYCEFVKTAVSKEKYVKSPIEHLKLYGDFRKKGVSKALNHILVVIQKVQKQHRYKVFLRAANKVMKRTDWKCDAYKEYVEKFVK
jgi:hypothetical protein